jgi:hypothetical protein
MSADNGIYVFLTVSEKGPEYRVTYANAIGNIYGEWNNETARYEGDIENIRETFRQVPVFYSLNEALDFAEELEHNLDPTEDGVCVINEFKDHGYIFNE